MKILILTEVDGFGGHYDHFYDGSTVDSKEVQKYVDNLWHQLAEEEFENDKPFDREDIPSMVKEKFNLKELYNVIDVVEYGY